jgi:hypothetical protein
MTKRRFGVELEFNIAGAGWDRGRGAALELLRTNGFNRWTHHLHHDGSGIEIPSPILCGKDGLKELKEVVQLLRENGGRCTHADGLHVHHEATEFRDRQLLYRLLRSWKNNHPNIHKLVAARRYRGAAAHYCYPIQDRTIEDGGYTDKFTDINTNHLNYRGTIEIRLHEGTLDYDKIEAWVLYGQSFMESVLKRKRPIRCAESHELLLNRIRTPKAAKAKLLAVAR